MISTRISSKGQIDLPKAIRDSLSIEPGTYFDVELKGREIILRPLQKKPIDSLYGRFSGETALNELEREHQDEISLTQKLEGTIWTGDPEITSLVGVVKVEKLFRTDHTSDNAP